MIITTYFREKKQKNYFILECWHLLCEWRCKILKHGTLTTYWHIYNCMISCYLCIMKRYKSDKRNKTFVLTKQSNRINTSYSKNRKLNLNRIRELVYTLTIKKHKLAPPYYLEWGSTLHPHPPTEVSWAHCQVIGQIYNTASDRELLNNWCA